MQTHTSHGNVTKTAIGYVRVITQEQATEGVSLDAQRDRLRSYCKANGIRLVDIVADEGISGSTLDRPGLQAALQIIRRGRGGPCYDYTMLADAPMLDELARDLCLSPLLVVTGAGISLASGIPTFRGSDPGAVWSADTTTLGTRDYFERDPVGSWCWYLSRFSGLAGKQPNPAHYALAELEGVANRSGREFLLVTQNVDPLHEQAGSHKLAKVHGSADRVRCSRVGCRYAAPGGSLPRADFDIAPLLANPNEANIPHCPACGSLLRQHVLWFDESYVEHMDYQYYRVEKAIIRCAAVLFVGTSFSVGVTQAVLDCCCARIPVWSIDPSGESPNRAVRVIKGKAEEVLPAVLKRMHSEAPSTR